MMPNLFTPNFNATNRFYEHLEHSRVLTFKDPNDYGLVFIIEAKRTGKKLIKVQWNSLLGKTNVKYLEPGEYAEVRSDSAPLVEELNNGLA